MSIPGTGERPGALTEAIGRVALPAILALVVVDVLLVGVNFVHAPPFLSLDEERNFPTWYSSAKLLIAALAALSCWALDRDPASRGLGRFVWPGIGGLFAALSMDETATAHERLAATLMKQGGGQAVRDRLLGGDATKDAFAWPVLFSPVIVIVLYFLANAIYGRMKRNRLSLYLGLAGCLAFVSALALEGPMVYLSPPVEAWGEEEIARYALFTTVEESAEVLGATLMLASMLLHVRYLSVTRRGHDA